MRNGVTPRATSAWPWSRSPASLHASPQLARVAATQALPLLEAAVRDRPDDLSARESLGYALEVLDRREEALRAYEAILRIEPGRESTLHSSARVLARLERPDLARSALQKTIAVNPWRSNYRLALANACCQAGDWPGAVAACREAIRLNPELFEARSLLIQSYLRSHESRQGRRRVPDPASLLPRQPRGLAAVVRAAEAGGAGGAGSTSSGEP